MTNRNAAAARPALRVATLAGRTVLVLRVDFRDQQAVVAFVGSYAADRVTGRVRIVRTFQPESVTLASLENIHEGVTLTEARASLADAQAILDSRPRVSLKADDEDTKFIIGLLATLARHDAAFAAKAAKVLAR